MKIRGLLPLGLSLLSSAAMVWFLNAELAARGVGYDLGRGLLGSCVFGFMATILGSIGFEALRIAQGCGEKGSIIALAVFASFLLILFNAGLMSFGFGTQGLMALQGVVFWEPLAATLAQVVFSAWLSRYIRA